jgi:hypothetical protein
MSIELVMSIRTKLGHERQILILECADLSALFRKRGEVAATAKNPPLTQVVLTCLLPTTSRDFLREFLCRPQ